MPGPVKTADGSITRRAGLALLMLPVLARAGAPHAGSAAELGLDTPTPPLAAHYRVTITPARHGPAVQVVDWYFYRDAERIALLKGAIDETWRRDAQGRVGFQRTFHEHARVTDYSPGELATLAVPVDWAALATFIDARDLAALPLRGHSGAGAQRQIRLQGPLAGDSLQIDWLPALQLPARVQRLARDGTRTQMRLLQHASTAPAAWPQPDQRAANYLHLDAADFGDMDYEPVVRLSEALDQRSGWRRPHAHD